MQTKTLSPSEVQTKKPRIHTAPNICAVIASAAAGFLITNVKIGGTLSPFLTSLISALTPLYGTAALFGGIGGGEVLHQGEQPPHRSVKVGQCQRAVNVAQRNYFYEYHGMIAQMAGSMLTPAGRRMAQARAQTALQLYQAIYDEAQGCHLALRQALDGAFS